MNWGLLKGLGEGMSRTAEALERDSRAKALDKQQNIQNENSAKSLALQEKSAELLAKRHLYDIKKTFINPKTGEEEFVERGNQSPGFLSQESIQAQSAAKTLAKQGQIEVMDPKSGVSKFVDSGDIPDGWVTKMV